MPTYEVTTLRGQHHLITAANIHVTSTAYIFAEGYQSSATVIAIFPTDEVISIISYPLRGGHE